MKHPDWVAAAIFTADGRALVTAGADHAVRTWAVDTGKLLNTIQLRTSLGLDKATFGSSGGTLLTADSDGVRGYGTWPKANRLASRLSVSSRSRPLVLAQTARRRLSGTGRGAFKSVDLNL